MKLTLEKLKVAINGKSKQWVIEKGSQEPLFCRKCKIPINMADKVILVARTFIYCAKHGEMTGKPCIVKEMVENGNV